MEARRAHNPEVVGSSPASATRNRTCFDTKSNQVLLFILQEKLELYPGMGGEFQLLFFLGSAFGDISAIGAVWDAERGIPIVQS